MKTRTIRWSFILAILAGCGNERGSLRPQVIQTASLTVTDSPLYDYGSQFVEAHADKTFTVTNTGLKEATEMRSTFSLALNFTFAGGNYPGEGGNCAAVLGVGESCRVVVRFSPRYVGTFEDALKITYFNGTASQATTAPALKGKGVWDNAGTLDSTLQPSGKVFTHFVANDSAAAIFVQSDGKIISAGSSSNGTNSDYSLVRHFPDGSADTSFGDNGKVLLDIGGGNDFAQAVAMQFDGKILIAGRYDTGGGHFGLGLVRLHSDGSPDSSFGTDGIVRVSNGSRQFFAQAVAVLPDRRIIVAGFSPVAWREIWLEAFHSGGTTDTTFGSGGRVLLGVGGGLQSMIVADGKLVVAGWSSQSSQTDALVMRYSFQGVLDSSFGSGGIASFDIGSGTDDAINAVRAQNDGKIVFAGYSRGTKHDFLLGRLLSSGQLDATFGSGGKSVISLGASQDIALGMTLQADKKIVGVGASGSAVGLVRLLPEGALDLTFGINGKVVTSLGSGTGRALGASVQTNGKILTVGESFNGADYDFFLARFWP